MKRKLLSLLLLAAVLLLLFPSYALAEEPAEGEEAPAENEETLPEEPKEESPWAVREDDVIYFGDRDDTPVAWLVLDAGQTNMGTEGVFLLSRDLWDSTTMYYDDYSTLWEGSVAQQWCSDFAEAAFTPAESALVPATDKHEDDTHLYALTWRECDLKGEKVFFLSVIELEQYFGSYGPENMYTVKESSMENYWWLRTPHYYHDDYHSIVLHANMVHDYLPYAPWAARPCINLSLQDALFLLPAEDNGAVGAVELPTDEGKHEWKLLAALEEHEFRAETASVGDGKLSVRYTGAETGEGAMLSLLVRDENGKALSLIRLARPAAAEGSLTLDLEELDLPENAGLFLFCEQVNGPHLTDYASPLQELSREPVPQAEIPAAPTQENPEQTPAGEEPGAASPLPGLPAASENPEQPAPAAVNTPAPTVKPRDSAPLKNLDRTTVLAAAGLAVAIGAVMVLISLRRRTPTPVILYILLLVLALLLYLRRLAG